MTNDISQTLLSIENLQVVFPTYWGDIGALDGVNLVVGRREILGLVGESGSGKSVTAMTVMRLLQPGAYRIPAGAVRFKGEDLLAKSDQDMEKVRGANISMVFQEPMTSLNPTIRVGDQIAEVIRVHQGLDAAGARDKAVSLLQSMRIPDAPRVARQYPHQLSGGMRQRAMIAMALSCEPSLLIADEPTTALDVTIQAQVLRLIRQRSQELGTAVLLITHDLGVVAEVCERVAVMYAGNIVEVGPVLEVMARPLHPYTAALLETIPDRFQGDQRLPVIPGSVANLMCPPAGCRFHPRCAVATARCREQKPAVQWKEQHGAACWHASDGLAADGRKSGGGTPDGGRREEAVS